VLSNALGLSSVDFTKRFSTVSTVSCARPTSHTQPDRHWNKFPGSRQRMTSYRQTRAKDYVRGHRRNLKFS
jgi:hypothetical protein